MDTSTAGSGIWKRRILRLGERSGLCRTRGLEVRPHGRGRPRCEPLLPLQERTDAWPGGLCGDRQTEGGVLPCRGRGPDLRRPNQAANLGLHDRGLSRLRCEAQRPNDTAAEGDFGRRRPLAAVEAVSLWTAERARMSDCDYR